MKKKLKINHCFIDTEDKPNMKMATEDKPNMKMAKQNTNDSIIKDKILQVSRVLTRNFKTCLRDSLLDAIRLAWLPG